ncbi:MAG TPA: ATP-binding protein [Terriglobia bacterium]|jgi:PAS domain S-box-containing protein
MSLRYKRPESDTVNEEIAELRRRLEEAEETLRAIQSGDVDALVVQAPAGHRIYTLESADRPYRLLVEEMQQGAITLDDNGTVLYSNLRFAEMLGRQQEELIGLPLTEAILAEDRLLYQDSLQKGKSGPSQGEVRIQRADNVPIPVLITFNRLPPDSGAALGALITDLTSQKHHERREALLVMERRARAEAEAANRLKDEFLATVSHELRTPLNAILGWASILRSGAFESEQINAALETIERNARAQKQLIEDLLDVSRIITGKLRLDVRIIDPVAYINAAIDALEPAAGAKGVRITKLLNTAVGEISADADRLQQIVWNLVSNAIKFTSRGGAIEVRLGRLGSDAEIVVADTGKGITQDFLPLVFDRFRQADSTITRSHGGLGLGLSIVRHLVELHGGEVHAYSQGEGQGATFIVKLPLVSRHDRPNSGKAVRPEAIRNALPDVESSDRLKGLSVLAVDDEPDARDLVKIMLERSGASVTVAPSAERALAALNESKFDLIVADIGMPGTDGYQLMQTLRTLPADRGGRTPAVALTAYAGTEDRLRVLRSGYEMHVAKPLEYSELVTVIENIVGRHRQ